jgi:HAD superfamily hydrolase (TIGR01450 family)
VTGASARPAGGAYEWFRRGRELHDAGNPAAAAELLAHAAAEQPHARSVREAWARALFDARRYQEAAREFLALTEAAPDDHYAHFGAGLSLWRLQRFEPAAEHLTIAVAMRPGRDEYVRAQRQVRATIAARRSAGQPLDGLLGTPPPDAGAREPGTDRPADDPSADPLTAQVLCRGHDVLLLDLDGVVYRGERAVPHAATCLRACRDQGARTAFVTNNAARPPAEVAAHLRDLGVDATDDDVVTSAQAGARLLRDRLGADLDVLAVGGPGVAAALRAEGLVPVAPDAPAGEVAAVLMGYGPDVGWRDLAAASYAVEAGALFVATNTDLTLPTDAGVAPGNGSLVAAVVTATGVDPVVAGKPFRPLLAETIERTGAAAPLVVGDRLDTDIEAANRMSLPSLLVLTGVTDVATLLRAPVLQRPRYLAADLRGLLARGRRILPGDGVSLADATLQVTGPADPADPLARVRAAAALCWAAADQDRDVTVPDHALDALATDVDTALRS